MAMDMTRKAMIPTTVPVMVTAVIKVVGTTVMDSMDIWTLNPAIRSLRVTGDQGIESTDGILRE